MRTLLSGYLQKLEKSARTALDPKHLTSSEDGGSSTTSTGMGMGSGSGSGREPPLGTWQVGGRGGMGWESESEHWSRLVYFIVCTCHMFTQAPL